MGYSMVFQPNVGSFLPVLLQHIDRVPALCVEMLRMPIGAGEPDRLELPRLLVVQVLQLLQPVATVLPDTGA
jgi:hypothetical protein